MAAEQLTGYRQADGRVGIRNHVVVLPVDDLSNAAAQGVAHLVAGVLALPHAYGRLQFGEDLNLTFRTLIGTGANPNVAAALVIGIEPEWTAKVADGIAATGKPVSRLSIERAGDFTTIAEGARLAQRLLQQASERRREPVERREVMLSTKCGESDTTSGLASNPTIGRVTDEHTSIGGTMLFGETTELTGGEHLILSRCADDQVRTKFQQFFNDYAQTVERAGVSLLGSQPTMGNIRGGLSTIEEKALGNIAKTGSAPIVDALGPAVSPTQAGLNFMDTSSAAAECNTLMAAAGSALHIFSTGQGNIVGHPIMPVIKITANPLTAATMSEHIDLDVSGLLRQEYNLDEAGARLINIVSRTINGRLTAAETAGHQEFILTKLYPSA